MRLRIDPTSPSGLSPIQSDTIMSTTITGSGSGTGIVETIVAGANVTVDSTDPKNPIVSASGEGGTTDHAALSNLDYATSGHTGFEPSLPITPDNPISKFLNGNRLWTEIAVGSGGSSASLYLSNLDSATAGYKRLSYIPDATETTKTIIANNNTVQGEKYLFDAAIDVTSINAGTWIKNFTRSVSNIVQASNFNVRVFMYATGGAENNLFTVTSTEIEDTSLVTFENQTTQSEFSCNATDRLGIQISFTTTRPVDTTFSYIVGDGRTAFISTPLALRHSQLRNVNEVADVQHLTAAQVAKLAGIADGAEVNVNADWDAISGDAQILNKPTIPTQYTDEMAQDAVGGMVNTTLTYTDGTPELKVTNPVTPQATGFTITAGTTPKTLTVADTASVTGTNTGDNPGVTSVTGTAPVVSSGGNTPAISMAAATSSVNGYATSTQITKLDGIATAATSNAKATGAELDTATDDVKFATAKALKDSHNVPSVMPGTSTNLMASNGTDWTSVSVSTAIGAVFLTLLPVGATWYGGTNSANPSTYLPGHSGSTWVANAVGKVIVGKAASGTFATAGATGGSETHTLTTTEMPSHQHTQSQGGSLSTVQNVSGSYIVGNANSSFVTATGGGGAHNNLQPYKVEYVWTRTA